METIRVTEVFTFCKKNGIDLQKRENSVWLFKDDKLLRTFVVHGSYINRRDWDNWKRKMGYEY